MEPDVLTSIRNGVALRPVAQQRNSESVPILDFASELEWKFRKNANQNRRDNYDEKQLSQCDNIMRSFDNSNRIINKEMLKDLLLEVEEFERNMKPKSREVLAAEINWPQLQIAALEGLVQTFSSFENLQKNTVTKDQNSSSADDSSKSKIIWYQALLDEIAQFTRWLDNIQSRRITEFSAFFPSIRIQVVSLETTTLASAQFNMLYDISLRMWEEVSQGNLSKFDLSSRAHKCFQLFEQCLEVSTKFRSLGLLDDISAEIMPKIDEIRKNLKEGFNQEITVRSRISEWSKPETVVLRRTSEVGFHQPTRKSVSSKSLRVKEIIKSKDNERLSSVLNDPETKSELLKNHVSWARNAAESDNWDALVLMKNALSSIRDSNGSSTAHWDWLVEFAAFSPGNSAANIQVIEAFMNLFPEVSINHRISRGGISAMHVAARNSDFKLMSYLISNFRADPNLLNGIKKSACSIISAKWVSELSKGIAKTTNEDYGRALKAFDAYFDSPNLSDVTLVCESDGNTIFAHKIILSAQCDYFKVMLEDSSRWQEGSLDAEVAIPDISSTVLRHLVKFLYTGSVAFVADQTELGIELLSAASRFMLPNLSIAVESLLIPKIANHNALTFLKASLQFNSQILCEATSRYILENYETLADYDEDNRHLLLLLENASLTK